MANIHNNGSGGKGRCCLREMLILKEEREAKTTIKSSSYVDETDESKISKRRK